MSPVLQSVQGDGPPDLLTVGHVTRDVHADGSFSLGGTVSFASLTAARLGASAAVVTRADAQLAAQLPQLLPGIALAVRPSAETTTFDNRYHDGFRTQYLLARADTLQADDVPEAWRAAPIVLLAPLAQELDPGIFALFPRRPGALIAATPQGWLRRRDGSACEGSNIGTFVQYQTLHYYRAGCQRYARCRTGKRYCYHAHSAADTGYSGRQPARPAADSARD